MQQAPQAPQEVTMGNNGGNLECRVSKQGYEVRLEVTDFRSAASNPSPAPAAGMSAEEIVLGFGSADFRLFEQLARSLRPR
jgi:hypothetical protein